MDGRETLQQDSPPSSCHLWSQGCVFLGPFPLKTSWSPRQGVTESKVSGIVESWTNSYGPLAVWWRDTVGRVEPHMMSSFTGNPGWIRPFQRVNHPKAGKHGGRGTKKKWCLKLKMEGCWVVIVLGKIYIHGKDVKGMGCLASNMSLAWWLRRWRVESHVLCVEGWSVFIFA